MKLRLKKIVCFFKNNPWAIIGLLFLFISYLFYGYLDDLKDINKVKLQIKERFDKTGKGLTLSQYIGFYRWYGSLLCVIVFFILGITSKFWFSTKNYFNKINLPNIGNKGLSNNSFFGSDRFYYCLVFIIILSSSFVISKRLSLSFWSDENWSLTKYTWGKHQVNDDDTLKFVPTKLRDTLYNNKISNNHILMSIFQKIGFVVLRYFKPNFSSYPPEWLARLPAFIFGIFTLIFIAFFLKKIGYKIAGISFVLLLSIHPWFISYMTYARGYTMVSFFTLMILYFSYKALKDSRWLSWIGFNLSVSLCLYTFMGFIHFAVLINIGVLIYIFLSKISLEHKIVQLKRWFVTNSVFMSLFFFMSLPALAQLRHHLSYSGFFRMPMTLDVYKKLWSEVFTGMYFKDSMANNPLEVSLIDTSMGVPTLIFLNLLLLLSIIWFVKKCRLFSVVYILFLLGCVSMTVSAEKMGVVLIVSAYMFPVFIISYFLMFIFMEGFLKSLCKKFINNIKFTNVFSIVPFGALLVFLFVFFYNKNSALFGYTTENFKGVVELTRWKHEPVLNMKESDIITVSMWREWQIYDPRIHNKVTKAAHLNTLIEKAKKENKKLFVTVGHFSQAKVVNKGIMDLLLNPKIFKSYPPFWGTANPFTLYSFELIK